MATSLASGRDNGAPPDDLNRAELAAVLASDVFKRSPKLSRLLLYLCEKCFQGLAGEITEYGIGLDVLGRDPGFDPQQDALVRVDTHHLRKRLKEYYAAAGSEHPIHIILPSGHYAPKFVRVGQASRPVSAGVYEEEDVRQASLPVSTGVYEEQDVKQASRPVSAGVYEEPDTGQASGPVSSPSADRAPKSLEAPGIEHPEPLVPENPAATRLTLPQVTIPLVQKAGVKLLWIAGLAAMVLTAWWLMAAGHERAATPAAPPPLAAAQAAPIRIAAGDRPGDYTDHIGRIWMSDRFFQGGAAFRRGPLQIQRTLDGELFRSGREGQFVYQIPLSPGIYELHLYFAETGVATESLRSVSMAINSVPLSTVDIASDAGGVDAATVKIFKNISPAQDGILHLTFLGTGPSFLNALEIVPGIPGKMRPIRLTARDSVYRPPGADLDAGRIERRRP